MSRIKASGRKPARSEAQPSEVHQVGARSEAQPSEVHQVGPRTLFTRKRSSRNPGFTLLEVMAAVALLGILYSVLARVAIEGLRAEGESKRRIEASMLADERVAGSFTGLEGGVVMPPLGHSETTEGDFTVALDVALFVPPVEWGVAASIDKTPILFASTPGASGAQALRTVQLSVSWLEGAEERHVSRIIYLIDFERVTALAGTLAQAPAQTGQRGATQAPDPATPPSELELP